MADNSPKWVDPATNPDYVSIGMLYNHTVLVGVPSQEEISTKTVPMGDLEEVVLNGKYKTRNGRVIEMNLEIASTTGEYFQGYRFHGSNHLIYKRYGETYQLEDKFGDDVVARVI